MPSALEAFESLYDRRTGGWHMPPWLEHPFRPDFVEEWRRAYEPCYSPVEREVGRFYRALVNLLGPETVLETGTNAGYSTYCVAAGLRDLGGDRRVFTLDLGEAAHLFRGTEVEHLVTFVAANSLEVDLCHLSRTGERPAFDMLFLDSDHSYKTIIGEINRFAPVLRIGGTLILHDSMIFDGIALVVRQLAAEGSFEVVNLLTPRTHGRDGERRPGITVARKMREVPPDFLITSSAHADVELNLPGRDLRSPPLI